MQAETKARCSRCQADVDVHIINGQLAVCGHCGEPLPDIPVPQLSTKAQFGLLFGASSFIISVAAGIPAIVLGWLALREIRREPTVYYGESAAKRAIIIAVVGSVFSAVVFAAMMDSNRWSNVYHGTTDVELVAADAEWRWLHPSANGSDPSATDDDFYQTFFLPEFDDSSWQVGRDLSDERLGFGYGDPVSINIGEPPEHERGNAYFRHRFFVTNSSKKLTLRMIRDDGVIVYIDGIEVLRDNISDGEPSASLTAARSTPQEAIERVYVLPQALDVGEHTLVISLHNHGGSSSDLRLAALTLSAKQ